jgi:hypothetical protein
MDRVGGAVTTQLQQGKGLVVTANVANGGRSVSQGNGSSRSGKGKGKGGEGGGKGRRSRSA